MVLLVRAGVAELRRPVVWARTRVRLVDSAHVTARDVSDSSHVIATRGALEKLQDTLVASRQAPESGS